MGPFILWKAVGAYQSGSDFVVVDFLTTKEKNPYPKYLNGSAGTIS